jgi:aminoglycoside phosphotransferase (APT) family kinase protein
MSANALTSKARTMQLLKHETKIPLPDVLDFSSTIENELRCPYIIMSFIRGVSLYVWFEGTQATLMWSVIAELAL